MKTFQQFLQQIVENKGTKVSVDAQKFLDSIIRMVPARYSMSRNQVYGPKGEPSIGIVSCQNRLRDLGLNVVYSVYRNDAFKGYKYLCFLGNGWQTEEYLVDVIGK